MAKNSAIEWTHHTFNPWWGCVKVSEACRNCYAESFAKRVGQDVWGPGARRRFFGEKHWNEPLAWNRVAQAAGERQRVFCASMADVFEILPDDHPDKGRQANERWRLLDLTEATPALDWLLLTKRPENVVGMLDRWSAGYPPNVWIGTTIEDRATCKRLFHLATIPARVRFLSCEPLLEDITARLLGMTVPVPWAGGQARGGRDYSEAFGFVSWVIAGGESGCNARPTHPDWVRQLRDECVRRRVPFHFKQWGEWAPVPSPDGDDPDPHGRSVHALPDGTVTDTDWNGGPGPHLIGSQAMWRLGKERAGRILDGRTWDEFPDAVVAT